MITTVSLVTMHHLTRYRYFFPCDENFLQRRKGKIYLFECRVQRIARRGKNAFLSEQCKEIEENNRTGKTRDLFKKIRDAKGTFHAKWAQ